MAQYYGLGTDEPSEGSEIYVAKALRSLGPDWIVVHHVTWQSRRAGRQGDGEADFLVLHPKLGLLVLEVKGGGIELINGRWRSTDRHGETHDIKNPYEQALASKHALLAWLQQAGLSGHLGLGHGVVFPSLTELPNLGPAATPEITLTRTELAHAESALVKCMRYWQLNASLTNAEVKRIVELLAPTIVVRRDLADRSAAAEAALITLTAEQVAAFAGLRSSRGGLIIGTAGTGKTVLAIARAQQLHGEGFNTLLVCYNELLGVDLSSRFANVRGLTACTYHTLCFREAHRAGLPVPNNPHQDWWETGAPDLLVDACSRAETAYDAIVVDEAQDFSPVWLDSLRCLTSQRIDAPFFAFADPWQDLWNRHWLDNREFQFTYELQRNLRNTQQIADKVAATLGMAAVSTRGVGGPAPVWRQTRGTKCAVNDVIPVVEHLIDEGFGPGNLVVLCASKTLVAALREYVVGPYSFGHWGGRGIPVETVARFKGLEAEAVVLALDEGRSTSDITTAYVGMSRARSLLVAIGTQRQQAIVNWLKRPS